MKQATIYLLLPSITEFREAIIADPSIKNFPLKPQYEIDGAFYFKDPMINTPDWYDFSSELVDGILPDCESIYNAAALLVRIKDRIFALTFGNGGWHLLRPTTIEEEFGKKFTMICVKPDRLKTAETYRYEGIPLKTRCQADRDSSLATLRVETEKDNLLLLGGSPEDEEIAKSLTGKDSLSARTDIKPSSLKEKLILYLEKYSGKIHQEYLKYLVAKNEEKDEQINKQLNDTLINKFQNRKIEDIFLSPEDIIDFDMVDTFLYASSIHDWANAVSLGPDADLNLIPSMAEMTEERFKESVIAVKYIDDTVYIYRWSLFKCLSTEIEMDGNLYLLKLGKWFLLDKSKIEEINEKIRSLAENLPELGTSKPEETEGEYNERIAKTSVHIALMDKKLVAPSPSESPIEFCDLFTIDKKIIHVKKGTKSAMTSHLFAQGEVSAKIFVTNVKFREDLRDRVVAAVLEKEIVDTDDIKKIIKRFIEYRYLKTISEAELKDDLIQTGIKNTKEIIDRTESFLELIDSSAINPTAFTVIYAVITKKKASADVALPYFSKINLINTYDTVSGLGFNCKLAFVDVT